MEFNCHTCHSENIQRLSLVYAGGLSQISSSQFGGGVGFGSRGAGVGLGTAVSTGTQQSSLSAAYEPPERKPIARWVLLYFFGFLIVPGSVIMLLDWKTFVPGHWIVASTYVVVALLHVRAKVRFNGRVYPERLRRWQNSYLCMRCGEVSEIST